MRHGRAGSFGPPQLDGSADTDFAENLRLSTNRIHSSLNRGADSESVFGKAIKIEALTVVFDLYENPLAFRFTQYQLNLIGVGKLISFPKNVLVTRIHVSSQIEIAKELSKLDFLVVPSTADNAPSVISEALMCGIPVLGSSTGGIPEMLNNGNGLIFKSENAEDLARKILTFNIPTTNEAIAKSAKEKYGYSVVAKNLMEYYCSN